MERRILLAVMCLYPVGQKSNEALFPILLSHAEVLESYDYYANDFYNGALLKELFGPRRNDLVAWLTWLESDGKTESPSQAGFYLMRRGFAVSKPAEYPVDAGALTMEHGPHTVDLMTFAAPPGSYFKGTSDIARQARTQFLDSLNKQLFGVYGHLNSTRYHDLLTQTIGADLTLHASIYPRMRYRAAHTLHPFFPANLPVPSNPLKDFEKVVSVVNENDQTITVKIDLSKSPENRNQEIIQQMFFITHWQMVQKSYRESGLFPDEMDSTLYLLNDFIKTMETSGGVQQIYLMYERIAWDSMKFRMKLAHQYVSVHMFGAGYQPFRYQTIADVFAPLYPIYGLIMERHAGGVSELKRLFSNLNPDPLDVIPGKFEPEKSLNFQFHANVAGHLEPGAPLMVVSKTPVHTRLYKSVGFTLESSTFYEPWNANKDVLRGTRESYLKSVTDRIERQR